MKRLRRLDGIAHMVLGGLVFWTPNIAVHWITAHHFNNDDVVLLTVLLPVTTYFFFRAIWWPFRKQEDRFSAAIFVILGIWMLGPSMLTISSALCGGGASQPDAWRLFTFGTILFPLFTFMMSTYDGSIIALLLTTLLLPMFANFRAKRSPVPVGLE